MIRNWSALLLLLLASASAFAQTPSDEPCKAFLPASLRQVLPKKFPGYRLARVSDYSKDDIDQHKKNFKGNACLGAASVDVDGDGFADFAFLLTDEKDHTMLAAARNASGKFWQISKLYEFRKEVVGGLYVDPLKSGSYQDLFDMDPAPADYTPELGGVRRYKAQHSGFIAGGIESSGVAFFFTGKRWVHLWLSD